MPERVLTAAELNRATLQRQMLLERHDLPAHAAVERLVALQAQEPASPHLALWTRLQDYHVEQLHASLHDRSVVKGTLLRVTLHVVTAGDYLRFWPAVEPSLQRWRAAMFRHLGLGAEVPELGRRAITFAPKPRFGTEISAHLPPLTGGVGPAGQTDSWWAVRPVLPFLMAPGDPPWSFGRRPRFVAATSWLGLPLAGHDEGLRHLVRRFLAGFGPAGIDDLHQFSRAGLTRIRTAVASLGDEVVRYRDEGGRVLYDLADLPLPRGELPAPVRFLPMWDSILLAYRDRGRVIPEPHRRSVIRANGDFMPTFLVDGHVAGLWRSDLVNEQAKVTPLPFAPLAPSVEADVAVEAARLERFLDPLEPAVYSRYIKTWLKGPLPGSPPG